MRVTREQVGYRSVLVEGQVLCHVDGEDDVKAGQRLLTRGLRATRIDQIGHNLHDATAVGRLRLCGKQGPHERVGLDANGGRGPGHLVQP